MEDVVIGDDDLFEDEPTQQPEKPQTAEPAGETNSEERAPSNEQEMNAPMSTEDEKSRPDSVSADWSLNQKKQQAVYCRQRALAMARF